jgi:RNA polymerase sigma-70 factor (ECF subfamily)
MMADAEHVFQQYRSYLFAIAYRMLGSVMDAEDMVQETFLRWQQVADQAIDSPKAYLTAIITRLCIDYMRSARVQREAYIGPWLPEPLLIDQSTDTADTAALSESLSMAFLVLLETLTPTERATFLLREVFGYGYADIAQIVDKSEANCRQMVSRAKQHLQQGRPRFAVSTEQQQALTFQFLQTCFSGDLDSMVAMLAEDVTVWSDGGGKAVAATRPIHGAHKAAQFVLGLARKAPPNTTPQFSLVNGDPGIIVYVDGLPAVVLILEIDRLTAGGVPIIQAIRNIVNPDKLRRVPPLV